MSRANPVLWSQCVNAHCYIPKYLFKKTTNLQEKTLLFPIIDFSSYRDFKMWMTKNGVYALYSVHYWHNKIIASYPSV